MRPIEKFVTNCAALEKELSEAQTNLEFLNQIVRFRFCWFFVFLFLFSFFENEYVYQK